MISTLITHKIISTDQPTVRSISELPTTMSSEQYLAYRQGISRAIQDTVTEFRQRPDIPHGTIVNASVENNDITMAVCNYDAVQKPENQDKFRDLILKASRRPPTTEIFSIVGDTPGAFGHDETPKTKAALKAILEKQLLEPDPHNPQQLVPKQNVLMMYGYTGSKKPDGRAGTNPIITEILNENPMLAQNVVGLCVGHGTPLAIEKYNADIPRHVKHLVVTSRPPHTDPVSKEHYPEANFGADSPLNNLSEFSILLAGGTQASKEAVDALKNQTTIIGVKGLRGENNPSTFVNGTPKKFLEGAEIIDVVAEHVRTHPTPTSLTPQDIEVVIDTYIYGEQPPKNPTYNDLNNQRRRVHNKTSYDSGTKPLLFLQMKELLMKPDVYMNLPHRSVVVDADNVSELPNIVDALSQRRVSPAFYRLPKYDMKLFEPNEAGNFVLSDKDVDDIRHSICQLRLPPELRKHKRVLDDFNDTFIQKGYNWTFNKKHKSDPELVNVVNGFIDDGKNPTESPLPESKKSTQNRRFELGDKPTNHRWKFFPQDVQEALEAIELFLRKFYIAVLKTKGFSEEQLAYATGGSARGTGERFANFNIYDGRIGALEERDSNYGQFGGPKTSTDEPLVFSASNIHEDWSHFTGVGKRGNMPGLIAKILDLFYRIETADDNCIVFNFGTMAHVLTALLEKPLFATEHGVVRQGNVGLEHMRKTWTIFGDPDPEQPITQGVRTSAGGMDVKPHPTLKDYSDVVKQNSAKTYGSQDVAQAISAQPIATSKAKAYCARLKLNHGRL